MSEAFSVHFFTLIKFGYTHTQGVTCFLQVSGILFFFHHPVYSETLNGFAFIVLFSSNTPVMFDKVVSEWYQRFWNATDLCIYSSLCSHLVVSNSWYHGLQPAGFLCPWDFPGKNARVGCHFLLQGIFPTQGLRLGVLLCRQILYHLSQQ